MCRERYTFWAVGVARRPVWCVALCRVINYTVRGTLYRTRPPSGRGRGRADTYRGILYGTALQLYPLIGPERVITLFSCIICILSYTPLRFAIIMHGEGAESSILRLKDQKHSLIDNAGATRYGKLFAFGIQLKLHP